MMEKEFQNIKFILRAMKKLEFFEKLSINDNLLELVGGQTIVKTYDPSGTLCFDDGKKMIIQDQVDSCVYYG
jgi:hypothetical protein